MEQIWLQVNKILFQTNAFNFILLVVFFVFIYKKCKIGNLIEDGIKNIEKNIDNSALAKNSSIEKLEEAKQKVSNVQSEIEELETKNNEIIEKSVEKIEKEADDSIAKINENAEKSINSKEKEFILEVSKETVSVSIELAKEHIKSMLLKNPKLHNHFINESLKELDKSTYEQQI